MEELINTIITQAPNFIFAGVAVFVEWRALVAAQKRNDLLTERIIQMSKDCDCDGEKAADPQTIPVKRNPGEY